MRLGLAIVLVALATFGHAAPAFAGTTIPLTIKVIHARPVAQPADPKLADLAKALADVQKQMKKRGDRNLKSFRLKDELKVSVGVNPSTTTRVQLPISKWMSVRGKGMTKDGKLDFEFELEKFEFKATAAIAEGATLAVGGPPFEDGWLILAITRPKD